jgi:hypothetical protein
MRIRLHSLGVTALVALLAAQAATALPPFFPKPNAWTSFLATSNNQLVKDGDFATWVKNTQTAVAPRTFKFIASFGTCYGGGFLTELQNKGVTTFGANSASTYFEPVTIDTGNKRTYYNWAWKTKADVAGGPTDQAITNDAYDAILRGNVAGIPANPEAAFERAQYNTDAAGGGAPPTALGNAMHKFAILWVGQPSSRLFDFNDLNNLYTVLRNRYGYAAADIYILYGNGANPGLGQAWVPNAAATGPNLQTAFNTWLKNKINAQPQNDTNLVFFWAGDHGAVDYAISIEVDNNASGVAGSGVAAQKVVGQVGQTLYEAGSGTNIALLLEPKKANFKSLSFGDDFQNPATLFDTRIASPTAIIYFSVDNTSSGSAGSEVNEERVAGRLPGADIYAATDNGNRRMFEGMVNLGLLKVAPNFDDLNDFVLRDDRQAMDNKGNLLRPFFYTDDQTSWIWVADPVKKLTYVYYDFAWNLPTRPWLVDALAIVANLQRRDMNGFLYFDPFQDYMLFSVGRQENMFPWNLWKPCDVLALGNGILQRWRSCAQLGLDANTDNVDGLDIGAGRDGRPISFDEEWPWPQYPYPNTPSPGSPSPPPPSPHNGDPVAVQTP